MKDDQTRVVEAIEKMAKGMDRLGAVCVILLWVFFILLTVHMCNGGTV